MKKKDAANKSKDYLYNLTAAGRLNAQPFHVSKSFEYFACVDVISLLFGEWGISTIALLTNASPK